MATARASTQNHQRQGRRRRRNHAARIRRVAAALIALMAVVGVVPPAPAAEPLPGNAVRVSPAGGNQIETSIAVNPTNPRNLVAGYIDSFHCGVAWSDDGGATWTTDVLTESTEAAFQLAGDPVVDFDAAGIAYYLCMNTANSNAKKSQYVYRSTDGGATWNEANPALAISPTFADHDKGGLVVDDRPSSPYFGNVYVAATDLTNGQIRFARSTDGATSFSTPLIVNDADIGFAVSLAVGADGAVYAAWEVEQSSGVSVAVRVDRSDDGGQNFGALTGGVDHVIRNVGVTLGGVRPVPPVGTVPGRGNGFPSIGTHPTNPSLVYAVWAEAGPGADDSDIMFSRSTDRGETWSTPVRVNVDVDPPGDFSSQFWPTMAVDPVDGDINIIWYSDQNDPDRTDGTPLVDLYFTRSSNAGVGFETPIRATTSPSRPGGFFGDYLGIDAYGGVAHPIWVDTTFGTGTFDAATTQIGPADMSLVKTDTTDAAVAGTSITYDLTVTNAGPAEARDVIVSDQLPAGTTLATSSVPCSALGAGLIECEVAGPLPAATSMTVTITLDIDQSLVHDAGQAVTLTNHASVASSQPDPSAGDNSAAETTTVVAETDLAVTSLSATGPSLDPVVGASTTRDLTATVTNLGPSGPVDTAVTFTASADPGVTVTLPATPAAIPALAVGGVKTAEQTATLTCDAPGTHTIVFQATAAPDEAATNDPVAANDSAAHTVTVECLQPVAINIKPGSATNPINQGARGAIPVAVLTTGAGEYGLPVAFDATSVNVASLRFGPLDLLQNGVGAPEKHQRGHFEDSFELDELIRDGDLDLIAHFPTQSTPIPPGTVELCVRGTVEAAGMSYGFVGCDTVVLKPE